MTANAIQELRKRIESEIEILENRIKGQKGVYSLVKIRGSINALKDINSNLSRIEEILQLKSYDLVFIGNIGVGKTTAICHLFNLIYEDQKAVGKNKKTIKKYEELLSTGSGRTTICEVAIKPSLSRQSFLEIESYSDLEIEEFIKEACTYFWHKKYSRNLNLHDLDLPPEELIRAVINITNTNLYDHNTELFNTCSDINDFIKIVLERAALPNRKQTQLKASSNFKSINDEKKWLKDNFGNLNLGKIEGFSLPKRINVYVSKKILDFSKYPRFKLVVDTRGMDGAKDRKDLSDYIRERHDSICLFAEQFSSAPSNVSTLLKRYLTQESKGIDTKIGLLVLSRKGEPENVIGLDGKVEDRESGIEIRRNQINDAFARDTIKFVSKNVIFYDALQFYDDEQMLKTYYEQSDVDCERINILDKLNDLIIEREISLKLQVKDYERRFDIIRNDGVLTSDEEYLINNLKKKIEAHKYSRILSNFENKYEEHLRSYHVMVFRAINNRWGIYDLRGIDIYFEASRVSEDILRDRLIEPKAEIIGALDLVEKHASESSGLKPVMQTLKEQVNENFDKIIIKISQEVCERVKDALSPETPRSDFWRYARNRWGQGPGYRNDVLEQYGNQIQGIDNWLSEQVNKSWEQDFMDKIIKFFGEI